MADKRQARQARRAEKQKKKRADARATRGSRFVPQSGAGPSAASAASWPVGECYVAGDWHLHGAPVQVAFSRRRDDGRVAAAFFELELGPAGLTEASFRADLSDDFFHGELARRSDDERPMVHTEPAFVVQLVTEAAALAAPSRWSKIHPFLAGIAPATESFPFQAPGDAPKPPPPSGDGLLARLKRMVTG